MRTLLTLALLTAAAAAQDSASDLFYRAFWLEQAEGKVGEAEALYNRILVEHQRAPEAPRALLGLVRIGARLGADVGPVAEALARDYPGAETEIAEARRIVEATQRVFDPEIRPEDAPIVRKLKQLWAYASSGASHIDDRDRLFLVDAGAAAHPLLRAFLRSEDYAIAQIAAAALLQQGTPEALTLVAAAIDDRSVLFKAAILEALRDHPRADAGIVAALARLAASAPQRLKEDLAATVGGIVVDTAAPRGALYELLGRLLRDEDPEIGGAALANWGDDPEAIPDDCVAALLEWMEAGRAVHPEKAGWLLVLALRPAFADRIEKVLLAYGPVTARGPLREDVAAFTARIAFRLLDAGRLGDGDMAMFHAAASSSGAVAADILRGALQRGNTVVANSAAGGLHRTRSTTTADVVARLGERAAPVRWAVLEALHSGNEARQGVGSAVLRWLGIGTDFDLVDRFLAESGTGLTARLPLSGAFLVAVGPEKAGSLVRHARDAEEAGLLLDAGLGFLGEDPQAAGGLRFFEEVVPRVGPGHVKALSRLARYANLRPLLARVLLDATGEEWGWAAPEEEDPKGRRPTGSGRSYSPETRPGPYLWVHMGVGWGCFDPSLRDGMPDRVMDEREEVAKTAATVAAQMEDRTDALLKALRSPYPPVRGVALIALAGRGDVGIDAVRAFCGRGDLTDEDRGSVADALETMGGEAAAGICAEVLATRKDEWENLWYLYPGLAPGPATDLALVEAVGEGGPAFRDAALRVLTKVNDPRRIEVFRKILVGNEPDHRVMKVVETVADQYLIELGEETLGHLRNANDGIRAHATKAVERLKFYADAKRTFSGK